MPNTIAVSLSPEAKDIRLTNESPVNRAGRRGGDRMSYRVGTNISFL
ncbi:MAG: hypothetical protein M3464_00265 [Chloroflexota bacterium]|nr:hypothetical protein [Chloroflexota bacterium]